MTPHHENDQSSRHPADRFTRETADMDERSEKLREGIEEARQDWERKRADQSVPGANPPEGEEGQPEEASYPSKRDDEEGGSTTSPANP
jgi:hypothetical protein